MKILKFVKAVFITGLSLVVPSLALAGPFEDGMTAYQAKNYTQAMAQFKQAAASDNTLAEYNIGVMYAKGLGVPKDDAQAAYWYKKVAYKGIKEGQFSLGMAYFFGGVNLEKDYAEAGNWLEKAAHQGHPKAQFRMGNIYGQGMGRSKDPKLAFEWFSKAAAQNEHRAQNNLGIMYALGEGVERNMERSNYWRERAAENGNEKAIAYLNSK